jgi:glycosyltransferase involved in cell wall biosynthesis
MTQNPLVSVLIPVYNAGKYFEAALFSIINQTYPYLEIIIINDGSTDGCLAILTTISDSRIKLITQANKGKAAALNKALEILHGDYFIIQDADDKSYPQRVEKQLHVMQQHVELAAVYIGYDLLLANQPFAPTFEAISVQQCQALIADFKHPGHDASGMYRLSLIKHFRFDQSLQIGQGIDFILQVGEQFPIICLDKCLYSYRINDQSITHENVANNHKSVNLIRKKACARRQLNFEDFKVSFKKTTGLFNYRHTDIHVIPHCMKSVLNLKLRHQFRAAFYVGWQCIVLQPLNPYYYKPLLYVIAPLIIIKCYRYSKRLLFHSSLGNGFFYGR